MIQPKPRWQATSGFVLSIALVSSIAASAADTAALREESILAVVARQIYPGPDAAPIENGVVIVVQGKITAVGARATVPIPEGARIIGGDEFAVTAGFQNSHVHFTEDHWANAAMQPASALRARLDEMLSRYGFTTAVDTASLLENTLALRRRIESNEVPGPRILTAGLALYPPNGVPFYVREHAPPGIVRLLPQPSMPEQAVDHVRQQTSAGADIVKLFAGSWVERGRVLPMPQDIANAAVAQAHRQGRIVFAHPSNGQGLEVALRANVDVLAHTLDDTSEMTAEQWARARRQNVALVPTLKLFGAGRAWPMIDELHDYARAGGQILFGTDAGFLTDYDPTEEYECMAAAGLGWREILSSLTTAPAQRFGEGARRGRVAPGFAADLVLLGRLPSSGPRAFADVRVTVRNGRVVWQR